MGAFAGRLRIGDADTSGFWKRIGGFIVGAAIIIGTIVAIAAWQNWNPF
jgi:hypothetical protein